MCSTTPWALTEYRISWRQYSLYTYTYKIDSPSVLTVLLTYIIIKHTCVMFLKFTKCSNNHNVSTTTKTSVMGRLMDSTSLLSSTWGMACHSICSKASRCCNVCGGGRFLEHGVLTGPTGSQSGWGPGYRLASPFWWPSHAVERCPQGALCEDGRCRPATLAGVQSGVVVAFSSLAKILGKCSTIHFPPALFFFFNSGD